MAVGKICFDKYKNDSFDFKITSLTKDNTRLLKQVGFI